VAKRPRKEKPLTVELDEAVLLRVNKVLRVQRIVDAYKAVAQQTDGDHPKLVPRFGAPNEFLNGPKWLKYHRDAMKEFTERDFGRFPKEEPKDPIKINEEWFRLPTNGQRGGVSRVNLIVAAYQALAESIGGEWPVPLTVFGHPNEFLAEFPKEHARARFIINLNGLGRCIDIDE
jgi:hypothetical protein